jgi:hypothetical protein
MIGEGYNGESALRESSKFMGDSVNGLSIGSSDSVRSGVVYKMIASGSPNFGDSALLVGFYFGSSFFTTFNC